LKKNSRVADILDALGTTGSAVAMPLPAERNRYTDTIKKDGKKTKREL